MTYIDKVSELMDDLIDDINSSDPLSLDKVQEYNRVIVEVMGGSKRWDDEYVG